MHVHMHIYKKKSVKLTLLSVPLLEAFALPDTFRTDNAEVHAEYAHTAQNTHYAYAHMRA